MTRFHINKKGEVHPCAATINCPFGDMIKDHYNTANEARLAYEKTMGGSYSIGDKLVKAQALFPNSTSNRKIEGKYYWDIQDDAKNEYENFSQKEQEAVKLYDSYRYYSLNESLWNGDEEDIPLDGDHIKSNSEWMETLDSIIENSNKDERKILYRGIKNFKLSKSKSDVYSSGFPVGETFHNRGYMSASHDIDTAQFFSGNDGIIFEISTKGGYEKGTMEVETLLPRDSLWTVVGRQKILNDNGKEIELIQIMEANDFNKL